MTCGEGEDAEWLAFGERYLVCIYGAHRPNSRFLAMARGVSDGFCQMVALPLTIWHCQCVIDTSGTPIFFALVAGVLRMPSAWAGFTAHGMCQLLSTALTISEPCQSEMCSKSAYRKRATCPIRRANLG